MGRVLLGIRAALAVEDVLGREEDEAGAGAAGRTRRGERAIAIDGERLGGMLLAVVHVREAGGTQDPVRPRRATARSTAAWSVTSSDVRPSTG